MADGFVTSEGHGITETADRSNGMADSFVSFEGVTKEYRTGAVTVTALSDATFTLPRGGFSVIVGESGAGKTTLLNILGGMERPTSGRVVVDGEDISAFSPRDLTEYRRNAVGFVFQFYNLIPNMTARENVELAAGLTEDAMDADEALAAVGLSEKAGAFPASLSGGEQQRVAIARAIAKRPKLLLCDEPTGALDYTTGKAVLELLERTCREMGTTVAVITHNGALTAMADRVIRVRSGKIVSVTDNEVVIPVSEITW